MKQVWVMVVALVLSTWSSWVWAESDIQAPDAVLMKDGSLYRGTISEKTPNEVEIVLISGKVRTLSMVDVEYAGPRAGLPQTDGASAEASSKDSQSGHGDDDTKPMVTVRSKEARLSLRANQPALTYHRRAASAAAVVSGAGGVAVGRSVAYEEMCTAPCEVSMPEGTHTLAISQQGSPPVEAEPVTIPAGDSTLTADYESRAGIRTTGLVIALGGIVVGTVVMLSSVGGASDGDFSTTPIYVGSGLMLGGIIIGMPLMYTSDKVHIDVSSQSGQRQDAPAMARGVSVGGVF